MRILVTGTSGMLGRVVANYLFRFHRVMGTSRTFSMYLKCPQSNGDLTNMFYVKHLLDEFDPQIIVHCAASTNLELCERDKEAAKNINILTTDVLSNHNSKFVYISTDSVYAPQLENCSESSKTDPLNYYAWTKLQGETASLKRKNSLILRTNIYGLNSSTGNSLVEWAIANLANNKQITGYKDVFFNPVHTEQLAQTIHILIDKDVAGVLNVSSSHSISKYEFLIRIAEKLNLDFNLIKEGVYLDSAIKRSKNTTLNNDKMKAVLERDLLLSDGLEMLRREYELYTNK